MGQERPDQDKTGQDTESLTGPVITVENNFTKRADKDNNNTKVKPRRSGAALKMIK